MHVGTTSPVRLVMATPAVSVDPTTSLRGAATVLNDEEIGAVIVSGPDRHGGVLSERDIVQALAGGADPDETTVASAMADDPLRVDAETPIGSVADLMLETGIRHVPVTVDHQVVGMVSMRDALDVVRSQQTAGKDA